MLKKFLSLLMVAVMLILCCACNSDVADNPEKPSESKTDENEKTTDAIPEGAILLSGENRYKIVYADGLNKSVALPISDMLISKDPLSAIGYYTVTSDKAADDGSPEILVGKTNRALSSTAASKISDYRDYAIIADGNKIAIYAEDDATLKKAVSDFISKTSVTGSSVIYTNDKNYVVKYEAPEIVSLDGKKVMFIGNSFIYYGYCVLPLLDDMEKTTDDIDRTTITDEGYFYQICKANDEDVDVYNFTWPGANLNWIYENYLTKVSEDFFEQIDYVFLSEAGGGDPKNMPERLQRIMDLFPQKTQFAYMLHHNNYESNATTLLNDCKTAIPAMGVKIVDWGGMVKDVWEGKVNVEGSISYNRNTFVKNNKAWATNPANALVGLYSDGTPRASDNHHENPLAGYITAQMAYCTVTGKSAVGQSYDFCNDKSISKFFDLEEFKRSHYDEKNPTNFIDVFNSKADMTGLQKVMDQYIAKRAD